MKNLTEEEFVVEVSFAASKLMTGKQVSEQVKDMIAEQVEAAGKNINDYKIIQTIDSRSEGYIFTAVPK
ncbi:hypothetical protein [Paenibacillus hubeiensis]|uniref:hypothetical protein n=1 Tax=Paenibacillus hubeiensis TaxID=3077330 RepID=UPI0031BADFE7